MSAAARRCYHRTDEWISIVTRESIHTADTRDQD